MTIARFALPSFLADASFAGRPVVDHLVDVARTAGLGAEFVGRDDEVTTGIVVDGAYLGLAASDLAALATHDAAVLTDRRGEVIAVVGAAGTVAGVLERSPGGIVITADAIRVADAWQLAEEEARVRRVYARQLARAGARFELPLAVLDLTVRIEPGAHIGPNAVLRGTTRIGAGARVQAGAWLSDTEVGPGAIVRAGSVCEGAVIGARASVGPMAHLREGTVLEERVKVGNFVETKKAVFRAGAKASHLSYVGDAEVGEGANIGAGTITCNYDGHRKHRTTIGAGAFIGSNSALVAPIAIGDRAVVGAGSTITRDVEDEALAVVRADQRQWAGRGHKLMERNRRLKERGE